MRNPKKNIHLIRKKYKPKMIIKSNPIVTNNMKTGFMNTKGSKIKKMQKINPAKDKIKLFLRVSSKH